MLYLQWYDDSKRSVAEKIDAGHRAYVERFGIAPRVVLVNEAEQVEAPDMAVIVKSYVRRHNYLFGLEAPQ